MDEAESEPYDPPDPSPANIDANKALFEAQRHNVDAQCALARAETRVLREQLEALDPGAPATLIELATQEEAAQIAVGTCIARGCDGICALLDRSSMIHALVERAWTEGREADLRVLRRE